jgi:hypothetical protein
MILFLQPLHRITSQVSTCKILKTCVCLLASRVTSQPSSTPRALDFTLESLKSSLGRQQHQPTYNITFFPQPNFITPTTPRLASLH